MSGIWGIWNSIKETSEKVIDVYKEDLQDFTKSLAEDTRQVINKSGQLVQKIAETDDIVDEEIIEEPLTESAAKTDDSIRNITEKVTKDIKSAISSFFGEYEPQDDTSISETAKEIRVFVTDPEDMDTFNKWTKSFCLDDHTADISQILSSDEFLRHVHANLVPSKVSSQEFWKRYYFSLYETQEKEKKRAAILARAQAVIEDDEEVAWSDEEADEDNGIRILQDSNIPNDPGAGSPPTTDFYQTHDTKKPEEEDTDKNDKNSEFDDDLEDLLKDIDLDVDSDAEGGENELNFLDELDLEDDYDDWE